jgi:putative toxin-antitoxin system antitoxin component (TIGR02293 family)
MATLTQVWAEVDRDLQIVESGVPLSTLNNFIEESGLRRGDVHDIVLPVRTLKHRKARNEPLNIDESDKFARLVRVFNHAITVFGDMARARQWLEASKKRFDDRTPLQLLRTEIGGRMVEEMLIQIDEGMFT